MKQKLFTFLLVLIASVGIASAQSGTCGDNLTWELNTETGDLTISGTGAMADYTYNTMPWYEYRSSIQSVIITDGVTSIGYETFSYCSSLTSVTIPNSVTSIGDAAFSDCSSLSSVTIPNSVKSIGGGAFSRCSSLTSITIPNSVTSIGINAFYGCSSLTSVTIPNSVTSIGWYAFIGCTSLTSINVDSNNPNYSSVDGVLFNKDKTTLIQYPIGNTRSEYTIPNSVTSIGSSAFSNCSSLTSITIPNSVKSIGSTAFYGCSSLTSVTIGNSVTSIGDNAFNGCSSLTSVTIPNSVTSIGNSAFDDCSSLTSINVDSNNPNYSSVDGVLFNKDKTTLVAYPGGKQGAYTIPNSVTSIGNSAFSRCSSLTSVTIPNSVTSIGDYAFYNCSSLTSVTIPNSVTSIGFYAFYNCSSLTSVTFEGRTPPSIDRVFDNTNNCPIYVPCGTKEAYLTALNENNTIDESRVIEKTFIASGYCGADSTNLTWELSCDSVLTISGTGAMADYTSASKTPWYEYRSSIQSVIINDSVTSIGVQAFYECSSLTSVTIPNSVTSIGNYAFYECSSLTSVTIPNSVTSIGFYAFYECSSLTSITIPNSVTSIGDNAFSRCSSLKSMIVESDNTVYDSRENCNAIIETATNTLIVGCQNTIIPNSVTSIGSYAFWDCSSLTSITIPNSVTSIGIYAFDYCSSLTSITIPNSVTSIGTAVFSGCSSLTSITIPNSVTSIGSTAFSGCSSLTFITIPNSVTSIGGSAFYGCSSLTSVTIGNSVTSIGGSAFRECSSLTSVTIPNSVTSIGNYAFCNCSSLASITIPNSVTSIGSYAFSGCSSLTSITIPNSVTWIGNWAFYECSSLTSVTIGNSVTSIGNSAFSGCSKLTSVTIGNSVTSIGENAFYGCSSLISITIPNSVTWIRSSAFYGCSSLTSVTIPNSVTSIGYSAFRGCSSLTSITIPNSVTSIGVQAFYECSSLTSVTFEGRTPPSIDRVFDNTNNCPIYVPCGTKEAYVAALNVKNTIDESRVIEKLPYTNSVLTSDSTLGSVTITQEPTCTEPVIFRADAAEGYQFTQWSDGNTDNPRSLILTQDTTLTALFEQIVIEQDTIIVADSTGISDIIPDGQDTIPYVEVQPDGEITIDITDVRIGVITIVTIGTESGQVHPGFGGNYDELENTRVVMEYVLNPFGQTASPDKWYAFAVPFEVDIENGITRKYGNKSHVPGKDFMILEYDSELRSKTGKGWVEKKSGSLTPGHIYMLGIEGNCNRWLFEKKRGAAIVGDKEKDLQHYAHGNSKNNGWHGLGNTTLEYVDMSFDGLNATYVYTYDNQYGRYNIYSIEELILAVGQPFFTQGDNDGSVAFTPNNGKGKGNGKKNMPIYAPSYDVQPSHPRVLLTIETEKINATPDRLYITLHDDNQCGSYRIGRDFMRMDKGSKQVPNFWCPMADGTQLSAHGVSIPTTYTTIPLGIFTPAKGEYTINARMQDMNNYIVELYCQNVCLGILMQGVPFRLEMAAGTSYEYSIRISRRVSTDLNPAEDTQCDKDNKWYDVLGRPLPQDAHGIFIRKGEKIIK